MSSLDLKPGIEADKLPKSALDQEQLKRLLRIYTSYRTTLSLCLLLLFWSKLETQLGSIDTVMYLYTLWAYCVVNAVTLIGNWLRPQWTNKQNMFLSLIIDIVAINLLTHASGGIDSGLAVMSIVTVAAGSLFFQGQLATLIAAFAAIATLTEHIIAGEQSGAAHYDILPAGLLGASLFISSLFVQYLAGKARDSQQLAAEISADAAQLEQLNELVLDRMRTGIIVTDENMNIQLINPAAQQLLGQKIHQGHKLPKIFQDQISYWEKSPMLHLPPFQYGSHHLQISFRPLLHEGKHDTLVFIEDARELSQQAQQIKLASLGRLTSSIAHEIRNPLGAISHAAQLIQESPNLDNDDQHLVEIIYKHCGRMNQIIENVLQVSRGRKSDPEKIDLGVWVHQFLNEYLEVNPDVEIKLHNGEKSLYANFDPSQLRQIVSNLCDNGLRYSEKATGKRSLQIDLHSQSNNNSAVLSVTDFGEGVADEMRDQVFEPFFTTETKGSGLGLYICREMCESNQAQLIYEPDKQGRSRFVIYFAHPDKKMHTDKKIKVSA